MKKLLLLGGSRQQVIAIETAKRCGYFTVLCDYLPDNPGQYVADKYYKVSTTDRDAVLEVAQDAEIDGVLAYASDPAASTAASVAETMGLPGNPFSSVKILSEKHLFREYLRKNDFPCPRAYAFDLSVSASTVLDNISGFRAPVVLKPTDSSGSKGVTVVNDYSIMDAAIAYASAHSRNGILICEEYIENAVPYVIGGDIFVYDGEVRFWGLMGCLRDGSCPLLPVGEKNPSGLTLDQYRRVKDALQRLVTSLDFRFGEMNVEVMLGKDGAPYVLELGARAGGNMIPIQLSDISGIDLVRANVMCAMGDDPGRLRYSTETASDLACATYVLHTDKDGIYVRTDLSNEISTHIYRKNMYVEPGDLARGFDGADKALGILFLQFDSAEAMNTMMTNIDRHVAVVLAAGAETAYRGGVLL